MRQQVVSFFFLFFSCLCFFCCFVVFFLFFVVLVGLLSLLGFAWFRLIRFHFLGENGTLVWERVFLMLCSKKDL